MRRTSIRGTRVAVGAVCLGLEVISGGTALRADNQSAAKTHSPLSNMSVEVGGVASGPSTPGACCSGATCSSLTAPECLISNGDVFLGEGTVCAADTCESGVCCFTNGACSYSNLAGCAGTFLGGYSSDLCDLDCCHQADGGFPSCNGPSLNSLTISVPGAVNFKDLPSANDTVDCPTAFPNQEYHWQAFRITTCADVEISYCCSGEVTGEVRSPANSFIVQYMAGFTCECRYTKILVTPDDVSASFGGTLPDKCPDGNFHMRFENLSAGTYFIPIFIEDNDPMLPTLANPLEYQMQVHATPCVTGGCCTGASCSTTDAVTCAKGGGSYLGDDVPCTSACTTGACCRPDGSCTDATDVADCMSAPQPTTFFGGTACATANGGTCPPANDRCAFPAVMIDGSTPFDNTHARDDCGSACFNLMNTTTKDLSYIYTASCTGQVTISLCSGTPDFDSTLSVYASTACPFNGFSIVASSDDGDCDGSGLPEYASWSKTTFPATMGQQLLVRIGSFRNGGSGAGEATVSCTPAGCPCTSLADCRSSSCVEDNACNHATCMGGYCLFTCERYADVQPPGGNGIVNLDDMLCILSGFSNHANCPNGDIHPCGGNGVMNLDDILAVLRAYAGANDCSCTENSAPGTGVAPLCGSISP